MNLPTRKILVAVAAFAIGCGLGVAMGYAASRYSVPSRIRAWAGQLMLAQAEPPAGAIAESSEIITGYHVLDVTRIRLGRAYMLEETNGGHLLFATPYGQLSALVGGRAVGLGLNAPLGLEELREAGLTDDPRFDLREIRITDLLAVETGAETFDLFVSAVAFEAGCVRLTVHKTDLQTSDHAIEPVSRAWAQVFQTDCVPLENNALTGGSQAGGRMVRMGAGSIALSVGIFGLDEQAAGPRPRRDLGAILVLPLNGGAPRLFANGVRNPQGLVLTRDGALWETEHGPQGGDELNLIQAGRHYGWPHVTYGMAYAGRPVAWRYNADIGSHDGYEPPRYSWTPAVGVSNLIQPDPREFPHWANHFVVATLRSNELRLLRMEGDRVAMDEAVRLGGDRIRDIISLRDGGIALSTDAGDVVLLRNADRDGAEPLRDVSIAALDPLLPEHVLAYSESRIGAVTFASACGSCHSLAGNVRGGPPLNGVVGRRVGGLSGYEYSPALATRNERWTRQRLEEFIAAPQAVYPGTAMPHVPLSEHEIGLVARYLEAAQARAIASR